MKNDRTRQRALEILEASEKQERFISELLPKYAHDRSVNFPLLQRLVKSTTQWRAKIDAYLDNKFGSRLKDITIRQRSLLRLAACQLQHFPKVNFVLLRTESLTLGRAHSSEKTFASYQRLLFALLDSKPPESTNESDQKDSPELLAQNSGHPLWLVQLLTAEIGRAQTIAFCEANNRAWPVALRTNTLKTSTHQLRKRLSREGVRVEACKYLSDCTRIVRLPGNRRLDELDSYRMGLFQVQDESAALVGALVNPAPGDLVYDLCSAPGGKTTHLAQLMRNRGEIVALDSNATRLLTVKENCRRLGLKIVKTKAIDALKFTPTKLAQRVLLDAPCSGLGTLGRKSDARWSKSLEEIRELAALQKSLINHAATLVEPGGILVYSTCTIERAENEEIVEEFLKKHAQFIRVPPPTELPSEIFSKAGDLRTWPHKHGCGGAYACVLRRKA